MVYKEIKLDKAGAKALMDNWNAGMEKPKKKKPAKDIKKKGK